MSRTCSLDTQTYKHFVVIRKNKELPLNVLKQYLKDNYDQYCLIVHDKDKDKKTGLTAPIHYHFVGNCKTKRIRLQKVLNDISKVFKFDNNHGIEVDKYKTLENSLQYLIHKNNPDKYQYEFKDLIFGGWTEDELKTFLTSDCVGLNFDRIFAICNNFDSRIDVIREIGFSNYARYRSTILDIFEECQMLKRKENARKALCNNEDLPF